MEFRDYAAKETAALVNRLLVSQVETSVQQLRTLREALEAASRGVEEGSAPSPEADQEVQELIRKLNTAAGTAARVAAQKVQKEAQTAMEAVQDDLNVQRCENERLTGVLNDTQTERDSIREELQREREELQREREQLQKEIERQQIDIQRFTEDAQQEVTQLQQSLQEDFQRKLTPIIAAVATEKGLHMMFSVVDSGLVWGDPSLDLTPEIIARFDKAGPAPPRPAATVAPAAPRPAAPAAPRPAAPAPGTAKPATP